MDSEHLKMCASVAGHDNIFEKYWSARGDALFNLPAFQMAKLWSKHVGKTFFYSFDQTSKKKKHGGSEFLHGMPLIEDEGTEGGIGHGDDLPFVFDPEPLYNNTSPSGLTDPDDKKLQNIMTDLIAEFIRTGEPRIISDGQSTPWPAFTEEKSNFVEVTSKPRNHENFRLCQMALWSGIITKLQSSTCQALWGITKFSEDAIAVIDKSVRQGVEQGIGSIINGTMIANVGQKFNINTILNKTAKPNEGNQGGKVPFLQNILNKTLQNTAETSRPDIQVQEGSSGIITELSDVTASILRPIENESGGDIIVEEKSNVDVEANIVIPVTDAPTTEKPRGVFPFLPIVNRPTLLPRPPLFGKPQLG
ncbi:hypothetical protein ANN_26174 [Periplaneta americana]|uniref:Carboxylesterase type B domain-containing protein n=1 Tax=Periplaneta americana TaxID=6978 RepID=A0ABQ8S5S7_PERAM|nr:hypothetical protein ANN_26174 [Periplaneta americana]